MIVQILMSCFNLNGWILSKISITIKNAKGKREGESEVKF